MGFLRFLSSTTFLLIFTVGCQRSRDVFLVLRSKTKTYAQLHLIVPNSEILAIIIATIIITLICYWLFTLAIRKYVKMKIKKVLSIEYQQEPKIQQEIQYQDPSQDLFIEKNSKYFPPTVNNLDISPQKITDQTLEQFLRYDLLDNQRLSRLRSISYQTLQAAVRNAPKYKKAELIVLRKSSEKKVYELFLNNTLIGSGQWAHISLADIAVSPAHARIRRIDSRYVLYDLLSANGVFVNGRRLLRPRGLFTNDEIKVGKYRFRFIGQE